MRFFGFTHRCFQRSVFFEESALLFVFNSNLSGNLLVPVTCEHRDLLRARWWEHGIVVVPVQLRPSSVADLLADDDPEMLPARLRLLNCEHVQHRVEVKFLVVSHKTPSRTRPLTCQRMSPWSPSRCQSPW